MSGDGYGASMLASGLEERTLSGIANVVGRSRPSSSFRVKDPRQDHLSLLSFS